MHSAEAWPLDGSLWVLLARAHHAHRCLLGLHIQPGELDTRGGGSTPACSLGATPAQCRRPLPGLSWGRPLWTSACVVRCEETVVKPGEPVSSTKAEAPEPAGQHPGEEAPHSSAPATTRDRTRGDRKQDARCKGARTGSGLRSAPCTQHGTGVSACIPPPSHQTPLRGRQREPETQQDPDSPRPTTQARPLALDWTGRALLTVP